MSSEDESGNEIDIENEVEKTATLLSSLSLVGDEASTNMDKLKNEIFHRLHGNGTAKAKCDKRALTAVSLNTTICQIINLVTVNFNTISKKITQMENEIEKLKDQQEETVFEVNNMEQVLKTHVDDKRLLVKFAFKSIKYADFMSLIKGGSSRCSTCLEDFKSTHIIAKLNCGHFFHEECAVKWLSEHKSYCSLCKAHVTDPPPIHSLIGTKRSRYLLRSEKETCLRNASIEAIGKQHEQIDQHDQTNSINSPLHLSRSALTDNSTMHSSISDFSFNNENSEKEECKEAKMQQQGIDEEDKVIKNLINELDTDSQDNNGIFEKEPKPKPDDDKKESVDETDTQ
jgi:hypothetical protein